MSGVGGRRNRHRRRQAGTGGGGSGSLQPGARHCGILTGAPGPAIGAWGAQGGRREPQRCAREALGAGAARMQARDSPMERLTAAELL